MIKNKIILLAAGGTGGHLFSAIAIAEELVNAQTQIHLITDNRCQKYLTKDLPITSYVFDVRLNMSNIFNKIKSAIKLLIACIQAIVLIHKIKPNVIIGFGGYPSFPAMSAARILRIPMIIQEQNCFLGKSNRFFAKAAQLIALSYKETKNIDIKFKSKLLFTGNIVRSKIQALPKKNYFDSKEFHLFVFGGSQGAKIFSTLIPDALNQLIQINPNIRIHVTQQASQVEQNYLVKNYANIHNIKYELSEFFYNIPEIYQKTHLVIARSGASTIAELTNIGLPAIFIPYPHALADHQYFNAMALVNNGASWCYRQNEVSASLLAVKLNQLIANRELIKAASKQLLSRKSDGAKYLADTVLKIIE